MIRVAVVEERLRHILADTLGDRARAEAVSDPLDLSRLAPDFAGVITPLSPMLGVDMMDGLAKVVGAVDAIMFHNDGLMSVGFVTLPNAFARAVRSGLTRTMGNPHDIGTVTIVGGGPAAAAALATAVELGASRIAIVTDTRGGPGAALPAAHRMGLEVRHLATREARELDADFILVTDAEDALHICVPRGLVAYAVTGVDIGGTAIALADDLLVEQVGDYCRLLTGVHPDPDVVRQAVENSRLG